MDSKLATNYFPSSTWARMPQQRSKLPFKEKNLLTSSSFQGIETWMTISWPCCDVKVITCHLDSSMMHSLWQSILSSSSKDVIKKCDNKRFGCMCWSFNRLRGGDISVWNVEAIHVFIFCQLSKVLDKAICHLAYTKFLIDNLFHHQVEKVDRNQSETEQRRNVGRNQV